MDVHAGNRALADGAVYVSALGLAERTIEQLVVTSANSSYEVVIWVIGPGGLECECVRVCACACACVRVRTSCSRL